MNPNDNTRVYFYDVRAALNKLRATEKTNDPIQIGKALNKFSTLYAAADFVIFQCLCDGLPFWVTTGELADADGWIACDLCGQPCDRLLSNGEWQTQEERNQENQARYEAVSG